MDGATEQAKAAGFVEANGFTPDGFAGVLQQMGYRVELLGEKNGGPLLRSATGGLVFHVALSNPAADKTGAYLTARFFAALQIEGTLPLSVINGWNTSMRFARLHVNGGFLLLDMDVLAVGGMPQAQLAAYVQTWDRLVQGLIAYLRDVLPKMAAGEPVAAE